MTVEQVMAAIGKMPPSAEVLTRYYDDYEGQFYCNSVEEINLQESNEVVLS